MLAGMRLLATDLDGTLVFHHVVRQADAEALVRWRAAGNLLVLATGRSVRLVQHAVEVARASTSIGLDYDYAVCATGTTVIDAAGQVHRTRTLEADQVRAVVRAIGDVTQAPVSVFASTLECDYVLDDPIGLSTDQRTPPDRFTAAHLSQVAGLGVTSMPLHIPDVRAAAALARGLEETVDGISCTRSTGFVDVTAAGSRRGRAWAGSPSSWPSGAWRSVRWPPWATRGTTSRCSSGPTSPARWLAPRVRSLRPQAGAPPRAWPPSSTPCWPEGAWRLGPRAVGASRPAAEHRLAQRAHTLRQKLQNRRGSGSILKIRSK